MKRPDYMIVAIPDHLFEGQPRKSKMCQRALFHTALLLVMLATSAYALLNVLGNFWGGKIQSQTDKKTAYFNFSLSVVYGIGFVILVVSIIHEMLLLIRKSGKNASDELCCERKRKLEGEPKRVKRMRTLNENVFRDCQYCCDLFNNNTCSENVPIDDSKFLKQVADVTKALNIMTPTQTKF